MFHQLKLWDPKKILKFLLYFTSLWIKIDFVIYEVIKNEIYIVLKRCYLYVPTLKMQSWKRFQSTVFNLFLILIIDFEFMTLIWSMKVFYLIFLIDCEDCTMRVRVVGSRRLRSRLWGCFRGVYKLWSEGGGGQRVCYKSCIFITGKSSKIISHNIWTIPATKGVLYWTKMHTKYCKA